MPEPVISINGHILSEAEAMTVRVAVLNHLAMMQQDYALGDDEVALGIQKGYRKCSVRIVDYMRESWQ